MTPEEAIDLALTLLKRAAEALEAISLDGEFARCESEGALAAELQDAWNSLEVLRTEQALAKLVAKDPANQGRQSELGELSEMDTRIAQIKGWVVVGVLRPEINSRTAEPSGYGGILISRGNGGERMSWALYDAKALELVDELDMDFRLDGMPGNWAAVFDTYGQHHREVAPTRSEAICRAYIAAKEYLSKHGHDVL